MLLIRSRVRLEVARLQGPPLWRLTALGIVHMSASHKLTPPEYLRQLQRTRETTGAGSEPFDDNTNNNDNDHAITLPFE